MKRSPGALPRPAAPPLGGVCTLRPGGTRGIAADGRAASRGSPRHPSARPNSFCICATNCTSMLAKRTTPGRHEQVRIAEAFHFRGSESILPVETLHERVFPPYQWRAVYRRQVSRRLPPVGTTCRLGAPWISHRVERDFRVGPRRIWATKRGLEKIRHDLGKHCGSRTWQICTTNGSPITPGTQFANRLESCPKIFLRKPPNGFCRFCRSRPSWESFSTTCMS